MSDEELDAAIAERFKVYETGIHLPDEFKGRFVGSVRRKRVLWRLGLLGLICVMAAACVVAVNFGRSGDGRTDTRPALMASADHTNETAEVSCLMLLSFLRDCFCRPKSPRRKEEE